MRQSKHEIAIRKAIDEAKGVREEKAAALESAERLCESLNRELEAAGNWVRKLETILDAGKGETND